MQAAATRASAIVASRFTRDVDGVGGSRTFDGVDGLRCLGPPRPRPETPGVKPGATKTRCRRRVAVHPRRLLVDPPHWSGFIPDGFSAPRLLIEDS